MTSRRLLASITVPAAIVLAACSSSSGGAGSSGSTGGAPTSTAQTADPTSAPTEATGLAALLKKGALSVKTAHIELDIKAAGQSITGSGDEKLDNGKLTALQLKEMLPGGVGSLELIIIDGKTYAKLPAQASSSGKPWALVTANSSDPTIQQLAQTLNQTESSASLASISAFAEAAKKITKKGPQTVDGVDTTHYLVVVDPSKLPSSNPGKQALAAAGLTSLPVNLYVDGSGRPVKVSEDFSVKGQKVSTTISVSKYGQPVTIKAPPANQVAG